MRKIIKPDYISQKKFEFVENYIECGSLTKAAIDTGYSEKTATQAGSRLMKDKDVKLYLKERMELYNSSKVASADEVMEYLTSVMRGELKDQFDLPPTLADRTNAAKELAKRTIDSVTNSSPVTIINNIPRPKGKTK